MIQSMTAFARAQNQGAWGSVVCELRSINHRYLEISLRIPEALHELEILMRECIRHYVKRGKIECYLRYQPSEVANVEIVVNNKLAQQLCQASDKVATLIKNPTPLNTMDILRWPGILEMTAVDLDAIREKVLQVLEESLHDLVKARAREGEELKQLFFQRLNSMKKEVVKVRQHMPAILAEQRTRLIARFSDAQIQLDTARLEQELVLFAQKIDVTEELERLDTHISEVDRVLKQGGTMGRRLDFLMQELNREANTLGAKSADVDSTRASVELKVLIEQIREQVQNVE